MEDDADWDVRIKDQLRDFATATHALTQPLEGTSNSYADPTYPIPKGQTEVHEFQLHELPKTAFPWHSPYGDNWDLLWVGHCGMHFPFADDRNLPKGRVVWSDQTVPQKQYLWNIDQPEDIKEQYPDHTRVVHHAQEAVCSLGYAVTQKTARQILFEIGLKDVDAAYDINLRRFCEGLEGRGYHRCLTMQVSGADENSFPYAIVIVIRVSNKAKACTIPTPPTHGPKKFRERHLGSRRRMAREAFN